MNFQYGIEDAIPSVFVVRFTRSEDREKYELIAGSYGVETRKWYLPLVHKLPFVGINSLNRDLKIAESMAPCLIGLPFFLDLNDKHLSLIRRSLTDALK